MAFDKTNSGNLNRNDKEGNPKRPDYKGQINIEGKDYWLSAWIKDGKDGEKYMSLNAQPKDTNASGASRKQAVPPPNQNDLDDDGQIPF